jgi:hypothetical protein
MACRDSRRNDAPHHPACRETHSGHNIYLYQPGLVVDTIRKVVGKVRHLS